MDNRDRDRREAEERERQRLENERWRREHEERVRIVKQRQEEEARRRKQYREQREREIAEEEARKEEEKRKLLLLEEELCRRRAELFNYKFGDKIGLGNFVGLQIEDVTQLRIGVFGSGGSGKTAFIDTCERTLRQTEKGVATPSSHDGKEGTIILQDYLPELVFRLVDTRGFFAFNSNEFVEFENILDGKLQSGDIIYRDSSPHEMHQSAAFSQRLHGIIIVVKANDPRLAHGVFQDDLEPLRDILRKAGIAPITVVTHTDVMRTEEDIREVTYKAMIATGSSFNDTFILSSEEDRQRDPVKERTVFDIFDHALINAETTVKVVKQEQASKSQSVPPEILARGSLALEAYHKALSEGMTCDKRVPVMLIGLNRSGKTSLKKSLMGEPFNPDEDSTVGIYADPSFFQVSSEVWKVYKKGEANNFDQHVARLAVEHLRQEESRCSVPDSTHTEGISNPLESSDSDATPVSAHLDVPIGHDYNLVIKQNKELNASKSSASDPPNASSHDTAQFPAELSEDTSFLATSQVEISTLPEPGYNTPDMPENIATLIEMKLKETDKVEDEEGIISVLWDFGGQSVYYAMHPLFLTPRAIFLLVNDLSQNLHDRAQSVVKQGLFTESEDSFDLRTNFDYLDFWMSSVASLGSGASTQGNPKSAGLPEKLPPVFLVCTHSDTPYGSGDPCVLAREVLGTLQTKPYKSHLYDDVFVVDNTKSGEETECPEVVRLRNELLAVAKELPQMTEVIPIKWLRYEKKLQAMKEDGHKWITLESARLIASEECSIVEDDQFHTLLNFLHDLRVLIHFDDTPELKQLVVLDPQWMVDVFKEVITVRPYQSEEKEFKELWCKLEWEGILEEKLLEHVWGPLLDSNETSESLLAVMEKFSLLCPFPSTAATGSKQYLVPSMLMFHPPDGLAELIKSSRIPSLFLKFDSGHIPLGFFPRLVLQFFQWVKDECSSQVDPQLYHNFARFYTSEEENCSVILLCHSFSIEVVVLSGNASQGLTDSLQSKLFLSEDASNANVDVNNARAVRRQLELMLESMRNEFCWLKNMRYESSFICPVCCEGGSVSYCRTHRAQACKQEECLHFLPESQLCNEKSVSCTKSAIALNNRVPIEQFEPWLVSQIKQPTTDEQDGRIVVSTEGRKEVALPGEVQESLLSQTCDAKEVVLQLAKTMQLDQASLEQPEPETKSLIRCLARKAKDSNRRDVFEHLREITPAGTTGPLLPENLDVRDMPVSKGRKLTIYLCGGDEWMEVAEALGLAPEEIRFLEKRHVNPLDAALAFIANQRHITVGELYDLLNECGYPVLADLL